MKLQGMKDIMITGIMMMNQITNQDKVLKVKNLFIQLMIIELLKLPI